MKRPALLAASFLLIAGLTACNKRNRSTDVDGCPQQQMCTMELRTIGFKIVDSAGKPVVLDDFKTVRSSDGKVMLKYSPGSIDSAQRANGFYPVLTDGLGNTERNGLAFSFIGYRNSVEVVRERFIIGHDCCHIQLLEGPKEITLSE